jgi:AAA+ superfamily predicted ATPase
MRREATLSKRKKKTTAAPEPDDDMLALLASERSKDDGACAPDATAPAVLPPTPIPPLPPDELCGEIVFRRSLPHSFRARLLRRSAAAVILVTTSVEWCFHLRRAVRRMLGAGYDVDFSPTLAHRWSGRVAFVCYVRTSADTRGRPDLSGNLVADALAAGTPVFGIATDVALLPPEVRLAADIVVKAPTLRGRDVMKIIRATTGAKRCPRISDEFAQGLTPTSIAMAVRKDSTPSACIRRLKEIMRPEIAEIDDDVPTLDAVVGYGEAKAWGLALKADIDKRRADPSSVSLDTITRSLLLAGPPGVGKTFFARVLAKSCGIPLIVTSYGQWQSAGTGHLGDVMKSIRSSFDEARSAASAGAGCGAILLVDEVDSIPGRHVSDGDRNESWWSSIVNLLLTLVERGAPARLGVVLLACTNYANKIDPALTRSGRLDRTITLASPSAVEFGQILRQNLGTDLATADLSALASLALGMTGADAARIVRDARQVARDAGRDLVIDDLVAQLLPPETRSPATLKRVALHEAAHAVAGSVQGMTRLVLVTLVARGSEGFARFEDDAEVAQTRAYFECIVVMKMAGRAIDDLDGVADSGSGGGHGSDLGDATAIVASLHRSFGLGDGLLTLGSPAGVVETLRFDPALREIVERDLQILYARAQALVREHRDAIEAVADALVATRVLSGDEVRAIVEKTNMAKHGGGDDVQ